jgi:hypothetical protein
MPVDNLGDRSMNGSTVVMVFGVLAAILTAAHCARAFVHGLVARPDSAPNSSGEAKPAPGSGP